MARKVRHVGDGGRHLLKFQQIGGSGNVRRAVVSAAAFEVQGPE
jgi:hypothetical protein